MSLSLLASKIIQIMLLAVICASLLVILSIRVSLKCLSTIVTRACLPPLAGTVFLTILVIN